MRWLLDAEQARSHTTSRFTQEAQKEADRDGVPPIELIDGERLVSLFKKYELGLKPKAVYELLPGHFSGCETYTGVSPEQRRVVMTTPCPHSIPVLRMRPIFGPCASSPSFSCCPSAHLPKRGYRSHPCPPLRGKGQAAL
ncbi:MAG: restriction endonuclease [Flavobacteriales bacterium]